MKPSIEALLKKSVQSLGLKLGLRIGLILLLTLLGILKVVFSFSAMDKGIGIHLESLLAFAFFFSLGASGLIHFFVYTRVEGPLEKLRQSTLGIASGDFKQRIIVRSSDQIGKLAEALEDLRQKSEEITTDLKKSRQEFQTHLKNLEEELIQSEEAYRLLFNNDPNPIFVVQKDNFKILDANIMAQLLYGYSKSELVSKGFLDLALEDSRAELKIFFKYQKNLLEKIRQIRKNGTVLYVNLRVSQGIYLGRPIYIITANDITQRIQAEQQLAQASKMATLGEMSAGVAHELNQPLTVIKTGSSFLLRKVKAGQPIEGEVLTALAEEMDGQVDRASRIINHLREFGRKTEMHKTAVQINEAISGMLMVMEKQLELRQIKVLPKLDPNLPRILGDKNRLEQVFINLAMNARDALDNPVYMEKFIRIHSFFENNRVKVHFSDNGCGIPKEIQEKIFEPFFSTKGVGQGTGLGLSISYGIVRDYQGQIRVSSQVGAGTTFTLLFPAMEEDESR